MKQQLTVDEFTAVVWSAILKVDPSSHAVCGLCGCGFVGFMRRCAVFWPCLVARPALAMCDGGGCCRLCAERACSVLCCAMLCCARR